MRLAIIGAGNVGGSLEPPGRKKLLMRFSLASGIQRLIRRKRWCGGRKVKRGPVRQYKRRPLPNS
jgi:hypothetical protein